MNARFSWILVLSLVLSALPLLADDQSKGDKEEIAWFDVDHCAMCGCMADHKEEMYAMKWEIHQIDNGMLSVTVIPRKLRKVVDEAHAKMAKVIARLEGGEQLELCGFCVSMGDLMAAGADHKDFETGLGIVSLTTSDDPKVVEKIHKHAKASQEAYAKMLKERPKKSKKKKGEKNKTSNKSKADKTDKDPAKN